MAVLRPVDGVRLRAEKLYAVLLQKPLFGELHGERKPRLPAEPGQQAVGPLRFDDALHRAAVEGLDVHPPRHVGVRHDGGRVAVHEHYAVALFLEHLARLRAGIVEFASLTDDDRT